MPKLMDGLILNSIYKKCTTQTDTQTHTHLYSDLERPCWLALQLGSEEQVKILILKIEAEEKGFPVEGILSKKAGKWIVLEHCVGYKARKIQGRIMTKMEKKKQNIAFYLLAINL